MAPSILILALACAQLAFANVEKTIFLGPETVRVPSQHPTISDLHLDVLTPAASSLRTHVLAEFPSDSSRGGKETWLLLDKLVHGQRYEVRICWAATQPTAFELDAYELPRVWDTPELMVSLAGYSDSRQRRHERESAAPEPQDGEREASVLFLRISAAADYFTTNKTLMDKVPPVYVDIILDPYVLNVLPRSLVPTAGYIVLVAVFSWFVARGVFSWIQAIIKKEESKEKKDE